MNGLLPLGYNPYRQGSRIPHGMVWSSDVHRLISAFYLVSAVFTLQLY